MVAQPQAGTTYWYVTDFHERFYAIPVTLLEKRDKRCFVEFYPAQYREDREDDGYREEVYAELHTATRAELYETRELAAREAARRNGEVRFS